MKLKQLREDIMVQVPAEKMWMVLSRYGYVSDFHVGVDKSYQAEGSDNTAALGAERVCNIIDLGLHITLKERIVELVEDESYRYEVYEWKNFPVGEMYFGFNIIPHGGTQSLLVLTIDYRAKPALLTSLMAGKMHRLAKDVLLGYKHFPQTARRRFLSGK